MHSIYTVCYHRWCCISTIHTQIWCPTGICFRSFVILPLRQIIKSHNMALHADDTQMDCFFNVKSTNDANNALSLMTQCVEDMCVWMTQSLLKDDNSQFLVISSPHSQESVHDTSLTVGDVVISSSVQCRNRGVMFGSKLDMKQHVATICRSAFFQLRKIGAIHE